MSDEELAVETEEICVRSSPDSSTDRPRLVGDLVKPAQKWGGKVACATPTVTTRCPVCRLLVTDLSHHFALKHDADQTSSGRIIPLILPNQPVTTVELTASGPVTQLASRSASPVNLSVRSNDDDPMETGRKRKRQTHVPNNNKDERYWARRIKNNQAAKRSRDQRIKRERVIFEENIRLESLVSELKRDVDQLSTENKELHLKLDLIMDENVRLKTLLQARGSAD